MKPSIESVDLVEDGVIVNFGDGIAAIFATEFLYDHCRPILERASGSV
jgi:hypothetical protein